MSKSKWLLLAVLVWVVAAAVGTACYGGQAGPDLSALARQAMPAVGVLVTLDAQGKPLSQGTAFFVRADGVGVTCHHVLEGAASALVRMENGDFFPVEGTLAADPARDLALFKVAGRNLATVPLGDSSTLAPGQRVVAITAPEGLENTVADGLVSAVRELSSGPLVQVTVPLSPGSSGGPIFDLSGRVVAVAAVVLTEGQALNFAIPINAAKPLLAQPGTLTPLAPAERPADLEDWLRERPPSPLGASAFDLWLQGMDANLNGRYEEAVEHLRAALALDPSLYLAHCCLGSSYGDLGRHQEAVAAYQQAIRLEPDDANAHNNLGCAYLHVAHYQDALEACKEAIRLKPDYAKAHVNLGVAYGELGRYQEAMAAFKQAIRLKPDDAKAHRLLGDAYHGLGRYYEAVDAYKQAIRLKPDDDATAHYNLGGAYGALGRYQEAVEALKQAIRLKPDYAKAHYNLGVAYLILGDRGAALEEFRLLKDLDPGLATNLFDLIYP